MRDLSTVIGHIVTIEKYVLEACIEEVTRWTPFGFVTTFRSTVVYGHRFVTTPVTIGDVIEMIGTSMHVVTLATMQHLLPEALATSPFDQAHQR